MPSTAQLTRLLIIQPAAMKGLITFICSFLFISIHSQESTKRRLYKKIQVPSDYLWANYILDSKNFETSVIECGSFCLNAENCEFYTLDNVTKYCYLANNSVVNSKGNYTIPSSTHAFLDLGKNFWIIFQNSLIFHSCIFRNIWDQFVKSIYQSGIPHWFDKNPI